MRGHQAKVTEPDQIEYTRAMLPGLVIGAFLYWFILLVALICIAVARGTMPKVVAGGFPMIAGWGLLVFPLVVFVVGFMVRMSFCALNLILGKPIGCSNLAVCISGFTLYSLTVWVPLLYLFYKKDGTAFLITSLLGPLLGVACGSLAVRLYERRQRTFVPYPQSQFQFQLYHLFGATIGVALMMAVISSLEIFQILIFPIGYAIFQAAILLMLSWMPPVQYSPAEIAQGN